MRQGTVSVLIGVHSPIHSFLVLLSWHILYGKWPKFWQAVCIFLHDIGHWGLDYLDDYEQKRVHWIMGASLAQRLFGDKGWHFVAGHTRSSYIPTPTELYKPDKYSWHIAPTAWLWLNTLVEPKLKMGYHTRKEAVRRFKNQIKKSIESGEYRSTHSLFLDRCVERADK